MKSSVGFGMKLWPLLILSGAGMLVFAFFMPWWGISVSSPERPDLPKMSSDGDRDAHQDKMEKWQKEMESLGKISEKGRKIAEKKENKKWYEAMKVDEKMEEAAEDKEDEKKDGDAYTITVRLWGWSLGTSLTAFIFGLVILPLAIVPMFVGALKNWKWIGSYVAAIMGLIALILGMVFYFGSPSENAPDVLAQGVGLSPGPYLVMLGSLFVLIGGAFDGVFGTMALVGGGKKSSHAADLDELEMYDE